VSSPAVPWQRVLTMEILQLHAPRSSLHRLPYKTINWPCPLVITSRQEPHRKHSSFTVAFVFVAVGTCLSSRCPETALVYPLISRSLHINDSTCYNTYTHTLRTYIARTGYNAYICQNLEIDFFRIKTLPQVMLCIWEGNEHVTSNKEIVFQI
jgi:hypothetical protein